MPGILNPVWPLAQKPKNWPVGIKGGQFGAQRTTKNGFHYHEGIDLGAPQGTPVLASEDGIIIGSSGWQGSGTKGLFVYSPDTNITNVYGAVWPGSFKTSGNVKRGEQIATVGIYPEGSTMLHFEQWIGKLFPNERKGWYSDTPPADLTNPNDYLVRSKENWTLVPGNFTDEGKLPPSSSSSGSNLIPLVVASGAGYYLYTIYKRKRRK